MAIEPQPSRSGTLVLVGRPNVGKSTLLNAALEMQLAIVSKTAQTTRNTLLGVVQRQVGETPCEFLFIDTPGLHQGQTILNRRMNQAALDAAKDADVVAFVVDVPKSASKPIHPHREDVRLLTKLSAAKKMVLIINKIDQVTDKRLLLSFMQELSELASFEAIVPVSARKSDGVIRLLEAVGPLLPVGPFVHEADDITDRPMRFLVAEFVREQILRRAYEEVPHAAAVSIDLFEEGPGKTQISATIHIERAGQKRILIGEGGSMLKQIGTEARKKVEAFYGRPVRLELFVRETPDWRNQPGLLSELGYVEGERFSQADEPSEGSRKTRSRKS